MTRKPRRIASPVFDGALKFGAPVLASMAGILSAGTGLDLTAALGAAGAGLLATAVGSYFEFSRENRRSKLEKRQVLIVHAHEDLEKARIVAAAVREAGYSVWLDAEKVTPGDSLSDEIESAIRESGIALYIPPSGSPSSYVQRELSQLALEVTPIGRQTSPVVPVIDSPASHGSVPDWLADVAPLSLADPQWRLRLTETLNSAFRVSSSRS